MKIIRQVVIQAKPELVWDVIVDLQRVKEWGPGFEDYPFISADWPRAGAEAVWRYHAGFTAIDFKLKMKESLRGRALRIDNTSAFGTGIENYRFSYDKGFTTVDWETSSVPSLLGRIVMPLMKRKLLQQVDTTNANLKRYCERRSQEEP